jgi:hypothetical protein
MAVGTFLAIRPGPDYPQREKGEMTQRHTFALG